MTQAFLEGGDFTEPLPATCLCESFAGVRLDGVESAALGGVEAEERAADAGFSELDSRSCSWPAGSGSRSATRGCRCDAAPDKAVDAGHAEADRCLCVARSS